MLSNQIILQLQAPDPGTHKCSKRNTRSLFSILKGNCRRERRRPLLFKKTRNNRTLADLIADFNTSMKALFIAHTLKSVTPITKRLTKFCQSSSRLTQHTRKKKEHRWRKKKKKCQLKRIRTRARVPIKRFKMYHHKGWRTAVASPTSSPKLNRQKWKPRQKLKNYKRNKLRSTRWLHKL